MGFDAVLGQAPAVRILRRALARGRVHHAYRFEGPEGVGKELAALCLAQALVCTAGAPEGCGACSACRRVTNFTEEEPFIPLHPDVVLLGRGVYPKTLIGTKEATGISVEQVRRIVLTRAGYTPHEARHLVFIIRDADELTQASANALLKTLEEPRRGVHFILLTCRPHRLLDTIRSRTLPVRFGALPDAVLEEIVKRRGANPHWIGLARGSASRALELAEDDQRGAIDRFVSEFDSALAGPDLRRAMKLANDLPNDRGELRQLLLAFADRVALRVRSRPQDAAQNLIDAERHALLERALDALEHNAAPTLAMEALFVELRALGSGGVDQPPSGP